MRDLPSLRSPTTEDISAIGALYRLGLMVRTSIMNHALRKNGVRDVAAHSPGAGRTAQGHLCTTFGLIVYRERSCSRSLQKLAGYQGPADILRKAMVRRRRGPDQQFKASGMVDNGYSEGVDQGPVGRRRSSPLTPSTGTLGGSRPVSYWTAFLKANYPTEYMAALLRTSTKDKQGSSFTECRHIISRPALT